MDERDHPATGSGRRAVPSVGACVAVAAATALTGLVLALALRQPLRRPADPAGFQARLDAWNRLDREMPLDQRTTGPKRPRN
jgi:hypothetical protein